MVHNLWSHFLFNSQATVPVIHSFCWLRSLVCQKATRLRNVLRLQFTSLLTHSIRLLTSSPRQGQTSKESKWHSFLGFVDSFVGDIKVENDLSVEKSAFPSQTNYMGSNNDHWRRQAKCHFLIAGFSHLFYFYWTWQVLAKNLASSFALINDRFSTQSHHCPFCACAWNRNSRPQFHAMNDDERAITSFMAIFLSGTWIQRTWSLIICLLLSRFSFVKYLKFVNYFQVRRISWTIGNFSEFRRYRFVIKRKTSVQKLTFD